MEYKRLPIGIGREDSSTCVTFSRAYNCLVKRKKGKIEYKHLKNFKLSIHFIGPFPKQFQAQFKHLSIASFHWCNFLLFKSSFKPGFKWW